MLDLKPLKVYRRVLLLQPVKGMAITLTLANLALAVVPFLEPILFGRTIDLLTHAATRGVEATFHDGVRIFGLWLLVGVGSIVIGALVSLHAKPRRTTSFCGSRAATRHRSASGVPI
jgi:ATP-binding cassette, subfamily B, beta-glucan exporter